MKCWVEKEDSVVVRNRSGVNLVIRVLGITVIFEIKT